MPIFVIVTSDQIMEQKKEMTIPARVRSFGPAINGLLEMRREPNAIVHAVATIAVVAAGFVRHLDAGRWIALVFAIGLVWITEILNTSIERLCNHACNNTYHP